MRRFKWWGGMFYHSDLKTPQNPLTLEKIENGNLSGE